MLTIANRYFHRDISWLNFNLRVLLEAKNPALPLYEKIKFLSIYSSNLDEFFRVRYPALLTIEALPLDQEAAANIDKSLLETIQTIVNEQQCLFGEILRKEILVQLNQENIHLYYNEPPDASHQDFINDYFYSKALSFLQPVILTPDKDKVVLQNNNLYFIAELDNNGKTEFALLNIPHHFLSRFVTLPDIENKRQILFLDDVIRVNIGKVFPGYIVKNTYSIKMTRSADISLADEWSEVLEDQIQKMLEERELGIPSRFLYEAGISQTLKNFLKDYFLLKDAEMIEGSRYHNLKDLANLPNPDGSKLTGIPPSPLLHKDLQASESIFDAIKKGDHLLHFPYQTYNYILRFFNEAAISRDVEEIFVTLYRVASNSHIVNALISAAKNGKKVTAFIELKARFDEENNLNWAKKMKSAGVKIVYSIPNLKVHSKLALIKRKVGWKSEFHALLSTGNFNEGTARFYTDHLLLTSHKEITGEINLLFAYLLSRQQPEEYQFLKFEHLLVARFNLFQRFEELVNREIENSKAGREARIIIKINNLEERKMIDLLYKASTHGVKVELIVRGICCLIPEKKGLSDNITVYRIVDQYLEHSRAFIFHNNNNPEVYLGSADLMNRNLHRRIEVVFPVYNPDLKEEIINIISLQLKDNIQKVKIDSAGEMIPQIHNDSEPIIRSQKEIYYLLAGK